MFSSINVTNTAVKKKKKLGNSRTGEHRHWETVALGNTGIATGEHSLWER